MKCPLGLQNRGSSHTVVWGVAAYNTKGAQDMNSVLYVGMDVDSEKIVVAKLAGGSGSNAEEQVIANKPAAVKKYFASLLQANEVRAAYEAGCFGFGLYHQLTELGVGAVVAAPGLIPRRPSDRLKTDRRDARTLAFALRAGQLTAVHVPTNEDESVRDYLRMCEDLRDDLRRVQAAHPALPSAAGHPLPAGSPLDGEAQRLAGDPGACQRP